MNTDSNAEPDAAEAGPRLTVTEVVLTAGAVPITVTGELDIATTPTLRRRMAEIRAAWPDRPLHLNLSGLLFCDIAGLRALHALNRAGAEGPLQVRITAAGRCLDVLLELCQVTEVLGYAPPTNHRGDND